MMRLRGAKTAWALSISTLAVLLVLTSSAFAAACTSPAGNEGDINYSAPQHIMVYCNGTSWIAMGENSTVSFGTLTTGDLCTATSGTALSCANTLSGDVTSAAGSATATTVAKIQGVTVSGVTGTGNVVFSASPTFTGTLTGAAATLSGTVTLSGLNSVGVVTTNASGVLATNATLPAAEFPALTGDVTTAGGSYATTVAKIQGSTVSGVTGTGNVVFSASPTFTGIITGAAETLSGTATLSGLNAVGVVTTNSSGVLATNATLPAAEFPALTGDVTSTGGSYATTVAKIAGTTVSGVTGTGNVVFSTTPTFSGIANTGTIAAGTWNGSLIGLAFGGTAANLSATGGASQVLKQTSVGGAVTVARLACADLLNAAVSCSTDATNAGNISSGILGVAEGGTGVSNPTVNVIYKGNGASAMAVSSITDNGTIVSTSENIDATSKGFVTEVANGTVATVLNKLAKLDTSGNATAALTTDTDGIIGIVIGGAGTSGNAQIAVDGQASCVFDGATTAGHYVTISGTTAGDCTDAGATRSTTKQTIGRVLSTNGAGGTFAVALGLNGAGGSGGGGATPPAGSNGQVQFNGSGAFGADSNLFWDATNHRLGVGTTGPVSKLDVQGGDIALDSSHWLTWANSVGAAANVGLNFGFGSQITRRASDGHMKYESQASIHEFTGNVGIGTATLTQPLTVWGNIDSGNAGGYLTEVANAGTTGTTVNKLAKLTGAPATAVIAATTDTDGMIGIVVGNAGTTGNAQIAVNGQASCVFDGATTAGHFVTISAGTAGDCTDAGATRSTIKQTIGRVLSTNGAGGTFAVALGLNGAGGGASGTWCGVQTYGCQPSSCAFIIVTNIACNGSALVHSGGSCNNDGYGNCFGLAAGSVTCPAGYTATLLSALSTYTCVKN
jgi:hypothetical protein